MSLNLDKNSQSMLFCVLFWYQSWHISEHWIVFINVYIYMTQNCFFLGILISSIPVNNEIKFHSILKWNVKYISFFLSIYIHEVLFLDLDVLFYENVKSVSLLSSTLQQLFYEHFYIILKYRYSISIRLLCIYIPVNLSIFRVWYKIDREHG